MLLVNVERIKEAMRDCPSENEIKLYRLFTKSGDDEFFLDESFDKDTVTYIEKGEVIHVHHIPKSKVEAYKAMDDDEKIEFLGDDYDDMIFYGDIFYDCPHIVWDFSTKSSGWKRGFEDDYEAGFTPVYAIETSEGLDSKKYFDDDVAAVDWIMYLYRDLALDGKFHDLENLKLHVWLAPDDYESESDVKFEDCVHWVFKPDVYDWDYDFYSDFGNSVKLDFYEV